MRRSAPLLALMSLLAAVTASACGSTSTTAAASSISATTTAVTTTTTTEPKVPFFDPKPYNDQLADAVKPQLEQKGYKVVILNDSSKQAITSDLAQWRVVSIIANRYTAEANVYVKTAERTPEEKVDLAVTQAGLKSAVGTLYTSPSAMVADVCKTMSRDGMSVTATDVLSGQVNGNAQALEIFKIGIPILCPAQQGALQDVIDGNVPFYAGTYEIGTGERHIKPGTYRTTGSVDDCYWERTRPNGEIIDNNFVTHAQAITVTISPTDGSFTSQRCGSWAPVK